METPPKTYCEFIRRLPAARLAQGEGTLHQHYHDTAYGFPITDDNELFGRLILEINQAGLSWATILKKMDNFRKAFDGFEIAVVAAYTEADFARLMSDAGMIRNRLKIEAAISNARTILQLRQLHGSFRAWLDAHHPQPLPDWVKLFRRTFRFTGGEIVNEFLTSTGYLQGAHEPDCPVHARICAQQPPWMRGEVQTLLAEQPGYLLKR